MRRRLHDDGQLPVLRAAVAVRPHPHLAAAGPDGHPDQLHPQLGQGHRRRLRRHGHLYAVGHQGSGAQGVDERLPGSGRVRARRCRTQVRDARALPAGPVRRPARAARAVPHHQPGGRPTTARASGRCRATRSRHRSTADQPPYYVLANPPTDDERRHAAVPADDADGGQQRAATWPPTSRSTATPVPTTARSRCCRCRASRSSRGRRRSRTSSSRTTVISQGHQPARPAGSPRSSTATC